MSTRELKVVIAVAALVIMSFVLSFKELRYRLFGATTNAQVVSLKRLTGHNRFSGRERVTGTDVTYCFTDANGELRTETYRSGNAWPPDDLKYVEVQFIPGSPGSSRLAVMAELWPFFVSGLTMVIAIPVGCFLRGYYREKRVTTRPRELVRGVGPSR